MGIERGGEPFYFSLFFLISFLFVAFGTIQPHFLCEKGGDDDDFPQNKKKKRGVSI